MKRRPCATRWNSYYNSIKDLLSVQDRLNETMRRLQLPPFKDNEIRFLSEYLNCPKPIAEAILSLQGDKETYYGSLLPELMRIKHMIKCLRLENIQYCRDLLDVIDESLNKRFRKFLDLQPAANDAILASVSHPFFKLKWVSKESKERVKELFLNEARKTSRLEKQKLENSKSNLDKKKARDESYYMFLEDSDSSIASSDQSGTVSGAGTADLEALQYLNNKENSLQSLVMYPTIKKMFLKYNTCLPSSAPVKRLFSFGGMIEGLTGGK